MDTNKPSRPHNFPPEIGPHEGCELVMMLAGDKPLAMFSDVVPPSFDWGEDKFQPYVDQGRLLKYEETLEHTRLSNHLHRYVYFALPSERWRIERLSALNQSLCTGKRKTNREIETEIGQLLGYSAREIDVYVERFFSMRR